MPHPEDQNQNTQQNQNIVDIALLKQVLVSYEGHFQKIDKTFDKIIELTNAMNRMITLHEERIQNQINESEEMQAQLKNFAEQRAQKLQEYEKRMAGIEEDVEQLKIVPNEISANTRRIAKLEMWRYGVMAIVAVLLWFMGMYLPEYFKQHSDQRPTQQQLQQQQQQRPIQQTIPLQ